MTEGQMILVQDEWDESGPGMSQAEYDAYEGWLRFEAETPGAAVDYWGDVMDSENQILDHAEDTWTMYKWGYPQYSGE